jgi:hypothetical protein
MKTKLVTETVRETDFSNIEKLIESLNAIRANHNGDIKARLSGCEEFGYKIVCTHSPILKSVTVTTSIT